MPVLSSLLPLERLFDGLTGRGGMIGRLNILMYLLILIKFLYQTCYALVFWFLLLCCVTGFFSMLRIDILGLALLYVDKWLPGLFSEECLGRTLLF